MSVNKMDYEVLRKAAADYNTQSGAIGDVIGKINAINSNLAGGWQNETSKAFIERYETDYKKKLESIQGALAEISSYITTYTNDQIDLDQRGASAARG